MIFSNKITQQCCIQWSCAQWNCIQTQIFIPVIQFLAEKRWLKRVIWKWKFGSSLRSHKVVLGHSIQDYYRHIPNNSTRNTIETEFELFYQRLLKNISHILEEQISAVKTKLCRTWGSYYSIHVPHKYKKVIERLSKNNNIIIMKQDKERGVVIMTKSK